MAHAHKTRFRLSTKRTNPFKSAGASIHSTTGSRGVRISGSNAGYTMFRGSVKGTGYPPHSPVAPSLPYPCVTVCHHVSTGVYVIQYTRPKTILYDMQCASLSYRNSQFHRAHTILRTRESLTRHECRRIVWNLMTHWHRIGEINPARFIISDLSTVCFTITLYSDLLPSYFKNIIVHTSIHPSHTHIPLPS
jgi:hypothetical protein